MQAPIFTDTDAETTVELDESVFKPQNTHATNATKSIFDITLNDDLDDKESHEVKSYEERLQEEIKKWSALWRESVQKLKELKLTPHQPVDNSILSAENRAYLQKAPDLQRFLRESIDFRQKAYIFLEKYYPDFQDLQANLIEACEHHKLIVGESKLKENLANL